MQNPFMLFRQPKKMAVLAAEATSPSSTGYASALLCSVGLLVLVVVVACSGRKRLRGHLIRRLLLNDGGHAQRDSLVSTLSWRYEEDGDDDEIEGDSPSKSPRSPRLLGFVRARARRSRA
jgi:hypothetical protein